MDATEETSSKLRPWAVWRLRSSASICARLRATARSSRSPAPPRPAPLARIARWAAASSSTPSGDHAKNVTPQVVHVEGDPDHPINRGTLCPKGASLQQDIVKPRRLLKPQVRRPGRNHWEDISWDDALNEIARMGQEDPRRDLY